MVIISMLLQYMYLCSYVQSPETLFVIMYYLFLTTLLNEKYGVVLELITFSN